MFYSLVSETEVVTLLGSLGRVGERNIAAIDQVMQAYFRARDSFEPVSRLTLLERLREGSVTLLDVRPPEEFAQGHLPGALNVTLDHLDAMLDSLASRSPIVAYCRGPYCVLSFEAVARLRTRGIEAMRLEEGYPEWKAAGFPVKI
jgi:ArsR family transcriptional regulator